MKAEEQGEQDGHPSKKQIKPIEQIITYLEQNAFSGELEEDAFAQYTHTLQNRLQSKNPQAFRARFIKGYEVLCSHLKLFLP